MKRSQALLFTVMLLCFFRPLSAQFWSGIIDPSRAIDWTQAGVPGGIPSGSWTQSGSTILASACGNGSSDCTSTIQTALNACGTNHYVLLGAGTFKTTSTLTIPSNCALRGAGANQTVISENVTSGDVIRLGTGAYGYGGSGAKNITGGAAAGDTTFTVAAGDIGSFSTGGLVSIDQLNNTYVTGKGSEGACGSYCDNGQSNTRVQGMIVMVTNVNSTTDTVTFTPALPVAFTNTPHADPFSSTHNAGVENLQVYANNTGAASNFDLNGCAYCWVSGVESNYTDRVHLFVSGAYQSTVQNSYFSNAYTHTPGTDPVLQVGFRSTLCLIQNNIFERLHSDIIIEGGPTGNVIAYNYGFGDFDNSAPNANFSFVDFHGAHPNFNLIEGNVGAIFGPDNTWGSHGNDTYYRNWARGADVTCNPTTTGRNAVNCGTFGYPGQAGVNSWYKFQDAMAFSLTYEDSNINLVGNVAGSDALMNLLNYSGGSVPVTDSAWAICGGTAGTPCGSNSRLTAGGGVAVNFAYGYGETNDSGLVTNTNCPGGGDFGTPANACDSAIPWTSLFLHGSYDYVTNAITWSGSVTHTLPPSFYTASKPSWWGATIPWPSIGPDVTGGGGPGGHVYSTTAAIPAQACYMGAMGGDAGGTGSPLTFNANACYGGPPPPPAPPTDVSAVAH